MKFASVWRNPLTHAGEKYSRTGWIGCSHRKHSTGDEASHAYNNVRQQSTSAACRPHSSGATRDLRSGASEGRHQFDRGRLWEHVYWLNVAQHVALTRQALGVAGEGRQIATDVHDLVRLERC